VGRAPTVRQTESSGRPDRTGAGGLGSLATFAETEAEEASQAWARLDIAEGDDGWDR